MGGSLVTFEDLLVKGSPGTRLIIPRGVRFGLYVVPRRTDGEELNSHSNRTSLFR